MKSYTERMSFHLIKKNDKWGIMTDKNELVLDCNYEYSLVYKIVPHVSNMIQDISTINIHNVRICNINDENEVNRYIRRKTREMYNTYEDIFYLEHKGIEYCFAIGCDHGPGVELDLVLH